MPFTNDCFFVFLILLCFVFEMRPRGWECRKERQLQWKKAYSEIRLQLLLLFLNICFLLKVKAVSAKLGYDQFQLSLVSCPIVF